MTDCGRHSASDISFLEHEQRELEATLAETLWLYLCVNCGRQAVAEHDDEPMCCGWEMVGLPKSVARS